MNGGKRGVGRLVVVLALVVATSTSAVVGVSAVGGPVADSGTADEAATLPPPQNNTTNHHRNPSEVSGEGDASGVETWLASEMSGRLSESVNVSQSDRERARQLIDNNSEYAELAEQYAEVTGGSDGDTDAEQADRFTEIGALQREFLADVEQYRQTHQTYRQARNRSVTIETIRLAHELERRAAEVNRTAGRLNDSYENLSSARRAELDNVTLDIGRIRANVAETQSTVVNQTLRPTNLSVRAVRSNGSFANPVRLAGRLRTDDAGVTNRNLTLRIGNRTLRTTTDDRGRFEVAYRPTHLSVGEHRSSVQFQPANTSVHASANATVEFGVRQVEPNVTLSNRTEELGYNESLVVNGTVGAGGVGAPDVPLAVTVGGVPVARTQTDSDGAFGVESRLPANVSTGSNPVRVRVALSDRALAPTAGSADVSVESTPTAISVSDVQTFNETAFVSGRLVTDGDEPIPNRTVRLQFNGTTVGRTITNATGGYATTVAIPPELLDSGSAVRVVAVHPSEGNLESARANATVALPSNGTDVFDRRTQLGIGGLLGIAILGAFAWRFRSDDWSPFADSGGTETAARSTVESVDRERSVEPLFDAAAEYLDDGRPDAAVASAYAAVRRTLDDVVDRRAGRTHWEFYDACSDAGFSTERLDELKRLTEAYERAVFAAESVGSDDATEAVSAAASFRRTDGAPEASDD